MHSMDKYQTMIHFLKEIISLEPEVEEELRNSGKPKSLKQHDFLLKEGQVAKILYFVCKGCFRGFYYKDGKEITTWLAEENNFITSMSSWLTQEPSFEYIQAIEEAELIGISFEDMNRLYKKYHAISELARIINEQYYLELETHVNSLRLQTAKQRYEHLISHYPQVLRRVPLGYIASYLGITQETLSRIRAEK